MLQKLKELTRKLNEVPNINNGGCGIAALAIYKWIRSQGIVLSTKPVVFAYNQLSSRDRDIFSKNVIIPPNQPLVPPSHVYIRHTEHLLDSTLHYCMYANVIKDKIFHSITVDQLILTINNSINTSVHNTSVLWGPDFDRETGIPIIEDIMDVTLTEIVVRKAVIIPHAFFAFLNDLK